MGLPRLSGCTTIGNRIQDGYHIALADIVNALSTPRR
jgi:hypothetical protein